MGLDSISAKVNTATHGEKGFVKEITFILDPNWHSSFFDKINPKGTYMITLTNVDILSAFVARTTDNSSYSITSQNEKKDKIVTTGMLDANRNIFIWEWQKVEN